MNKSKNMLSRYFPSKYLFLRLKSIHCEKRNNYSSCVILARIYRTKVQNLRNFALSYRIAANRMMKMAGDESAVEKEAI
jgi:hypothetical protein